MCTRVLYVCVSVCCISFNLSDPWPDQRYSVLLLFITLFGRNHAPHRFTLYTFINDGAMENLFAALFTYAPRIARHQLARQAVDTRTHTQTRIE